MPTVYLNEEPTQVLNEGWEGLEGSKTDVSFGFITEISYLMESSGNF